MRKSVRASLIAAVIGASSLGAWCEYEGFKTRRVTKRRRRGSDDTPASLLFMALGGTLGLLTVVLPLAIRPAVLPLLRLLRRHPKVVGVVAALSGSYVVCDYVMGGVNELEEHGPGYRSDHRPYAPGYEPSLKPKLVTKAFGFKR